MKHMETDIRKDGMMDVINPWTCRQTMQKDVTLAWIQGNDNQ